MGIPLLAASVVGTAVSAAGSYRAAQYQAGVMKQNAQVATNNAMIASTDGEMQQRQQGMKTAQEVGQQTAAIAGSGVNTNSASSQTFLAGTRTAGVMDQSMLRFNQAGQVAGYDTQSAQQQSGASAMAAAAPINAFGTILGGASSVGNQWAMYQKYGVKNW